MMKFERLGDLVNIQIGKTPKREVKSYWGKGHPWVSIADLKGREIHNTKEQITDLAVKECGCKLIERGTLLLSFKLSIGKLAFAGTDLYTNEAICGLKIIDSSKIFPKYLLYALKAIKFGGSNAAAKGATLNTASLKALKIPLPVSIDDQIRIATILEKAEELIFKRQESIELLDEFLKSTFRKMFQEGVYATDFLGNLVEIQSGQVNPNQSPYKDMYHVGAANIESGTGKLINLKLAKEESLISGKYLFTDEHLLYSKIRPNLNKVSIPKFTGICSADIYPIKPKSNSLNIYYLRFVLMSERFIKYALRHADRANIPKVNREALTRFPISIPPPEYQMQFAQIVEKANYINAHFESSLQELENLYGVLSQRAFKGELDLKKIVVEYEEEYSATDNDRTEPKPINYEKVNVRPKRIPEMSLDEHYGIPEEIVVEYGSIETKVVDWPFFLKKHFSDRPVKIDDLAELFNRIYYEEGLYFKYDEFKEFLFEELKKDKPFLKQGFNEDSKQLELTIIHETS